MPLDPAKNFVRGATDASVASGDTTISVQDASIFVDPSTDGEYNVVVWDVDQYPRPDEAFDNGAAEIVRVTAVDTTNNDLTVARGQENTTAVSHPSGAAVAHKFTAKDQSEIESTFNEFYNSSTQELTADVNTTSVSTDEGNINDTSTDPSTNGELRRNGTDVKVHSGGAVKNMSNIGSGGGADDSRVQMFARRRVTK